MLDQHHRQQPVNNNIKRFNCLSTSKHQHQSKIINVTVIKAKEKNTPLSLSTNNICDIEVSSSSSPDIMDKCNKNINNPGDDAVVVYSSLTAISCDTSSHLLNSGNTNNTDNSDYGSLSLPSTNSRSYAKQFIDLFPVLMTKRKAFNYFQKTSSSITLTESSRNHYNDLWVGSLNLRRTAKPNLENEYHRENSLKLSILEARNLLPKRRYYCDICLDRTLYARTTSKTAVSEIFWAEDFNLNNLPDVSVMTISLYRDSGSSGKDARRIGTSRISLRKYRKAPNQLIGYITIPISEITSRTDIQTWLTLQPPTVENTSSQDNLLNHLGTMIYTAENNHQSAGRLNSSRTISSNNNISSSSSNSISNNTNTGSTGVVADQRNLPQLRIRARYQSLGILPLCNYWPLRTLILSHSLLLTKWLESLLSVKFKEEIANSLVCLHEHNNTLIDFLTNLVVREVSNLENDSMAFRSNTMATKAVECYVKFVGSSYLHQLLHLFIQRVLTCFTLWEVDPDKLTATQCMTGSLTASDTSAFAISPVNMLKCFKPIIPGSLISNQIILLRYFDAVWRAIQSSLNYFPSVLIDLFSSFRTVLEKSRGSEFCDNLISSCIFLRLICPALLSPSLFGLISAFPSEPACQRNLTLLAKSLQTLANFSTFDDKEPYMRFLNGYVTSQLSSMRSFIRSISTSLNNNNNNDHTIDKVNVINGADTNLEATGISNAVSNSLPATNPDQTRSTLTTTLPTTTPAKAATSQNNIKDTIDENCELANLHVILSDVIFRDSLTIPSVTTTNNTAPAVMNSNNEHNGITTDAQDVNSSGGQGIVSPIFLKPVCPTIVTSLPEELCSLPRILDDISRALQQITSNECKQYEKTSVNHTNTIVNNNHYNLSHHHHHQKGGGSVIQSNVSPSSSNPRHKSKRLNNDREQSLSPIHHTHHSHQYTSTGGGNTPYYTVHYNPGFHNPDSCCNKAGLNHNANNTSSTMNNNNNTNNNTGLLLPQLKQSASLTGLPSDVSQSNPNDYDEPYISPESDCDMHETGGVNSDHEVSRSKKAQTLSITSAFQSYSSSLSIANNNSSLITNYNTNNKTNSYSPNDKKNIYDHKAISLDKLNNSDTEHIYDMVPLSSSSSSSASSSPSVSPSREAIHHMMNGVTVANDSYIHQSDQVSNCNIDKTLISTNHVTLNIEKDNDTMIQTKTGDAANSNIIEQTPTSLSSSSLALSNKVTTSNDENVQYNNHHHHHHHHDDEDVAVDDEINKFNQRSVCKSISPRLFLKKQVTTANVILTKPNVMSSSSIDTTKISKLTTTTTPPTHFRSNSSSRENMFDSNINGDHFSFGASNTVQVNLTHHSPTHKVYNNSNTNVNNDDAVDNFVYRQHTHRKNASAEELYSYTPHSDHSNYDINDTGDEENSTSTTMNSMKATTTTTNNNHSHRKQPSELAVEIALLRYELLLSRQDALRAADRLSKQETEIYQLRQLLEQLRNNNNSNNNNTSSKRRNKQSIDNNYDTVLLNTTTHVNDEIMMSGSQQVNNSDPELSSVKKQNSACSGGGGVNNSLQNPSNTHSKVLQSVTATFKELDDAMARLELEQSELLREQARIRARIAATHRHQHQHHHQQQQQQQQQPITSCTQSIINPTVVSSKSKSLIRPKCFQSSIPKILINSEKNRDLPSPGHINYANSSRTNSNNNYIQKAGICSELKSAPKK
uniref:Ras-GAP domain-containing protein n=1 Tax=Trichobilharzia regenti TaxID=157069 RepID=A0AA85KGN8_TRIRE|nr:unnamed protein product [Trichobilharzia regenti]